MKNPPSPRTLDKLPAPPPAQGETVIAFGVVFYPQSKMYVPTRFEIVGGQVTSEKQIAPAGPYRPIAYQYISGAILELYNSLNLKEAHDLARKP